jgi:uncharacterized membrane protein YjgN (DUF898 family)
MAVRSLDDFVVEREDTSGTLSYDGEAGSFAGIAITNTLLSLVTLGFYRFWGKTRLRRYLWSRISLAGDRLEYVGRGKELFIGFCIAILVLIPLSAVPIAAEILLADNQIAFVVVQILQFILIFWLIQVAIYRARRYRLSRTKWRGIRAGQTGSAVGYAFRFFGWMLLSLVTLFLAYPWARTALQRYRVRHSWFGNQQFSFKARGSALLAPWLLVWLPLFFALVIALVAWLVAAASGAGAHNPWPMILVPAFLIIGMAMFLRYRVAEFRYFVSCTRFLRCRFSSDLHTMRVYLVYLASALATILAIALVTLGLVFLVGLTGADFKGLWAAILNDPEGGLAASGLGGTVFVVLLAWMVLVAAALSVIRIVVYLHLMTRLVCASLSISEVEEFVAVARSRSQSPAYGEGLADALDVGEIGF